MKKLIYLLILFILAFNTNTKASEWSNADITREAIFLSILYEDWRTTKILLPHGEELNPLIGPHPTNREIDIIVLSVAIGHLYIADNLNPKNRKYFQYISIFLDLRAVYLNHQFKYTVTF